MIFIFIVFAKEKNFEFKIDDQIFMDDGWLSDALPPIYFIPQTSNKEP